MANTEYPIHDIEVIKFHCPECMKKLSAPVTRAGTKAKCSCGAAIQVPEKHLTTFIPRELAQPDPIEESTPVFEIPKEDKLRIYEEEKLRIIARDMFAGYGKDIAGLKDYLGLAILSLILCLPVGVAALIFSALCRAAKKCQNFERGYAYSLVTLTLFYVSIPLAAAKGAVILLWSMGVFC